MAALALLFALLAIAEITVCCVTGSGLSLIAGLLEFGASLILFCRWAWSL